MRHAWLSLVLLVPSVASAQLVETARDVDVVLRHGMALVTTRIQFENRGGAPAEVSLRLRTPSAVGLVGLRVCSGDQCRTGRASSVPRVYDTARRGRRFSTQPVAVAWVAPARYGSNEGIRVQAAPVVEGRSFEIELRYAAPTREVLGSVDFTLPAQTSELGSPLVRVAVGAPGLELPTIDGRSGPIEVERDAATTLSARLPRGVAQASAWSLRCGQQRCLRYRVAAGAVPPTPRDVFLLLDVSPSARAAEPEVRANALRTLLGSLSPESRVTRVVYAREARVLDETPLAPGEIPLDAQLPSLGTRTLFEAAWLAIRERVAEAHDPLLVILGDGAIQRTPAARLALDELADSGAQLSLVSLAAREPQASLLDTVSRTLGRSVDAYQDGWSAALQLLAAPVVDPDLRIGGVSFGSLRAGETRVVERVVAGGAVAPLLAFGRRIRPTAPRGSWATGVATRLVRQDRRNVLVAASQDQILAARRGREARRGAGFSPRFATRHVRMTICRISCGCTVYGGPSRETITRMRARLRPAVRGCFARARRGRRAWSARMTLTMVVRYGELEQVGASQSTDPDLARCVVQATENLEDLPFSGQHLAFNFPFHSEAVPAPVPEPLAPHVDRGLQEIGVRASAAE